MDISPKLLEDVKNYFYESMKTDSDIKRFVDLMTKKKLTYKEAQRYSKRLGELLGQSFSLHLTESALPNETLYWNIAKAVVEPMIRGNHTLVMDAAQIAASVENKANDLLIGSITPAIDDERIHGLLDSLCEEDIDGISISKRLKQYTTNITESFFDDFIKENAEFQYQSGMDPQVIRIGGARCCDWCQALNGVYDYADVRSTGNDVWRRHRNCHCQVIFKNNKKGYMQGAHTKRVIDKITDAKGLLSLDEGTYYGYASGSQSAKKSGSRYSVRNRPVKDTLSSAEQEALDAFLKSKGLSRVGELSPKEYYKWLYEYRKKKG